VISACLAGWGGLTLAGVVGGWGGRPPSYSCVLSGAMWGVHIESENGGVKQGGEKGGEKGGVGGYKIEHE
jgi:hypothetical protein